MVPSDWAALGTCVTAVIAVLAAAVAWTQVRETRRQREAQNQPFVIVDIQPSRVWTNLLNLVIENTGATMARDVKITFDPALTTSLPDSSLPHGAMLREGIPMLPPRRRIEALLDTSHGRIEAKLATRYDVTVVFKDAFGRKQAPLRYVVDLGFMYDLEFVTEHGVHEIAKELKEISKQVRSWKGSHGLQVWTRDEDEYNLRDKIARDMTGHRRTLSRPGPSDLVMALGRSVLLRTLVRRLRERWQRPR